MSSRLAPALLLALAVLPGSVMPGPTGRAQAAEPAKAFTAQAAERVIKLPTSKSMVLDFPNEIRDVLVGDPTVADAVVRTNKRLYLIGRKFGTTNITVFGTNGATVADLQVVVQPDAPTLQALLQKIMPNAAITVETASESVILRGVVADPQDAVTAFNVASNFLGKKAPANAMLGGGGPGSGSGSATDTDLQVINMIKIKGKDQVMLRVTIAEVQREALKALGVNLQAAMTGGLNATLVATNDFTNSAVTPNLVGTLTNTAFSGTTVQALEQQQVLKTLAEPALTAISGEEANFVAGGEYPVPISSANNNGVNTVGIEFKKFGIKLNFIPVVMTEGRISLKISTEVSELTNEGAIRLSNITIPALKTRQAQTTLEMSSGSTMVLAGLIKDDVRQAMSGIPGAMNIPVLGSLFRSRDSRHQQTELAIFVQPVVVQPVAATKLERPDRYMQPASDAASYFLGRVNRVYRTTAAPPNGTYSGQYGYIFE